MKKHVKHHPDGGTTTTFVPTRTEKYLLLEMLAKTDPFVWTEVRTGGSRDSGVRDHRAMLQLQQHSLAKFIKSESLTDSRSGIRITKTLWWLTSEGEVLAKAIKKHSERFR